MFYLFFTESSDDASEEGDWPLQSGSESEDQWDELSDMGEMCNDTKGDSDQDEEIDDVDEDDDKDDDSDDHMIENGDSD